ncbi:MAG: hypothetical protein OXM62_06125 [bacterium]|nr:hypothetical protein [bacterium]MDE0234566.1 hypothetical protein [bacterium]
MSEPTVIDPYSSPPPTILTMEEALERGRENYERLLARGGSPTRNIERRLAWKRSRGIDTTAEEQACGLRPKETHLTRSSGGDVPVDSDFTSFFQREVLRSELGTPQWILYAAAAFDSVVEHPRP